jgi:hypothetical protein
MKIGAVYCIYEDSGFMAESVRRLYPLMDCILILIDKVPWNGILDSQILQETYRKAREIDDPDNKIEVITKYWKTEADERNYGMQLLHQKDIDWKFLVDEDELFNTRELKEFLPTLDPEKFSVYLFIHQMYWKNRNTVLTQKNNTILSAILYTKPGRVIFTEARMVTVFEGKNWEVVDPSKVVCHHMSYVRTDEQMLRKITSFSHASEIPKVWYEKVWLGWHEGMTDLHPVNPTSFSGTIPVSESPYSLDPI